MCVIKALKLLKIVVSHFGRNHDDFWPICDLAFNSYAIVMIRVNVEFFESLVFGNTKFCKKNNKISNGFPREVLLQKRFNLSMTQNVGVQTSVNSLHRAEC